MRLVDCARFDLLMRTTTIACKHDVGIGRQQRPAPIYAIFNMGYALYRPLVSSALWMQRVTAYLQRIMSSNATGRPPSLSSAAVAKLIKKHFYFHHVDEHSVKHLPSYDDRNYYFRGTVTTQPTATSVSSSMSSCGEYVLKLNNPLIASYNVLRGINDLLNHLRANGFTKCNQPLANREGGDLLKITKDKLLEYESHLESKENVDKSGECTFFLRVLTFIPGECLDKVDKRWLTPRLLYDVGHCVGTAEAILQVAVCLYGHGVPVIPVDQHS